jgi:4-hydroxy-2-oxoheptanedioate aldolase
VLRIPQGDATVIKQVLEIGATRLLEPMVETAAQARELVRAARYSPNGVRGVGSGLARSSRRSGHANHLHEADDSICLLLQLETAAALAQLDEIAAVDGVHGVFIGPADLSASMGHLGNSGHPDVKLAIDRAIGRILATG